MLQGRADGLGRRRIPELGGVVPASRQDARAFGVKGHGCDRTFVFEAFADGFKRVSLAIDEFDRVLGGGLVPGSLVLIGGDPGIGKSTLLLQASAAMATADGLTLPY